MRTAPLVLAALILLATPGCRSTDPAPVAVEGTAEELEMLTGEWSGSYESRATGRTGSIVFHLTADPSGAHGDVLMRWNDDSADGVSSQFAHIDREQGTHLSAVPASQILAIQFVRVDQERISGVIEPYRDPESDTMLETHFSGSVSGNSISGSFITYSDRGTPAASGTWKAARGN
jgi:hypothetical protein